MPESPEHPLGMIPGEGGLRDGRRPLREETGQEEGRFHLGAGHRALVPDPAERAPPDRQRGVLVAGPPPEVGPHLPQGLDDPAHRPPGKGGVPRENREERLRRQDAAQETQGGAGVPGVQNPLGLPEAPEALPVDAQDGAPPPLHPHPERPAGRGGPPAVLRVEVSPDLRGPVRQGAQQDGPVGDRLVPRHTEASGEGRGRTPNGQALHGAVSSAARSARRARIRSAVAAGGSSGARRSQAIPGSFRNQVSWRLA